MKAEYRTGQLKASLLLYQVGFISSYSGAKEEMTKRKLLRAVGKEVMKSTSSHL
jgi:hypothetical protein